MTVWASLVPASFLAGRKADAEREGLHVPDPGGIAAVGRGVDGAPGRRRRPAVDRGGVEVSERGPGGGGRVAGPGGLGRRRARAAGVWRDGEPAVEVRHA